ncbi:MAG: hypothetical protein GY847_25650 [Proteobacteria bacterium]|nr:hypothetical protein [Pseudomonadota bacterium]
MGFAEITHPYHPLRGQSFPILKTRKVSGTETLVLRGSPVGTFAVPLEWTDQDYPTMALNHQSESLILEFKSLLALSTLLNHLDKPQKRFDK